MTTVPQADQRRASTLCSKKPCVSLIPVMSPVNPRVFLNFTPGPRPTTAPALISPWHCGHGNRSRDIGLIVAEPRCRQGAEVSATLFLEASRCAARDASKCRLIH